MSRSQQQAVINQATTNSNADQTTAQTASAAEQQGIGGYEAQLAKFAANNPYKAGGEYATTEDAKLAGTADAGSGAITDQLQTQSLRTGQNMDAANATAAEAARANLRDLSGEEAQTTQTRIADESGYGDRVLGASEVPAQLEQSAYATSVGAANQSLGTAGQAAQTPGFWDTLGNSFATSLGSTAGGGNGVGGAVAKRYL